MTTKFLRLKDAAERVGWHPQHLWKVATDPAYEHVGFAKPVRLGKNSIAFVEAEVEAWQEARIRERDEDGFKPKPVTARFRKSHGKKTRKAKRRAEAV